MEYNVIPTGTLSDCWYIVGMIVRINLVLIEWCDFTRRKHFPIVQPVTFKIIQCFSKARVWPKTCNGRPIGLISLSESKTVIVGIFCGVLDRFLMFLHARSYSSWCLLPFLGCPIWLTFFAFYILRMTASCTGFLSWPLPGRLLFGPDTTCWTSIGFSAYIMSMTWGYWYHLIRLRGRICDAQSFLKQHLCAVSSWYPLSNR